MSKRYTFLDIYKKNLDLNKDTKVKINQIVIPKIQRPYAQGRQDGVCTYVRNTLLKEMFENFQTDEIFDFSNVQKITSAENLRSRASDEIVPFREFIIKDDTSALL